jgi:hypothetical protein
MAIYGIYSKVPRTASASSHVLPTVRASTFANNANCHEEQLLGRTCGRMLVSASWLVMIDLMPKLSFFRNLPEVHIVVSNGPAMAIRDRLVDFHVKLSHFLG